MIDLSPPPLIMPPAPTIIRPADDLLLRPSFWPAAPEERAEALKGLVRTKRITREQAKHAIVWFAPPFFQVPRIPPVLTYITGSSNSGSSSNYSYSAVSLGAAFAGRVIVVAGIKNRSGTPADPTSVSIAGNAVTLVASSAGTNLGCWIGYVVVPSGTSGTVAINFGASQDRNSFGLYSMTPPASLTPTFVHQPAGGGDATSRSVTLDLARNAVALVVAARGNTTAPSWTNATGDMSVTAGGSNNLSGAQYSNAAASLETRTITATASGMRAICGAVWQ